MPTPIIKQYVIPYRKESNGTLKQYVYASSASVVDLDGYTPYTDNQIQQDPPDITAATSLRDAIKIIDGRLRILDRDKGPHVTIPEASTTVSGTVIIGANLTLSNNVLSLTSANVTSALGYTPPTTNTTYGPATTETSGLMTDTDKIKLNGIETGANNYTLPVADDQNLGGVKAGNNVTVDNDGTLHLTSTNITSALGYTPPQTDTTYDAMTSSEASTGTETAARVISAKTLGDLIDAKIGGINLGVTEISTGTNNGTISVTTNGTAAEVSVAGLGSAAYNNASAFAAASHNQASSTINSMASYSKPLTTSAIEVTDSLNDAIGKLEAALDGKANSSHNHDSSNITTLGSYSKPGSTSAIETTDTLDEALGKLEAALDGKQASGSYLTTTGTAADSSKLGGELASAYALKSDITTGSTDGTIAVNGTNVAVAGLGSAAYTATTAYAAASHNQDSSTITAMTGYVKPSTASAIDPTDSLNDAIGKLERMIDNANVPPAIVTEVTTGTTNGTISVTTSGTTAEVSVAGLGSAAYTATTAYAAASHNHGSNEVTSMSGYTKASSVAAISSTDTLNDAIGILEKALDGKSNTSHNHSGTYTPYAASVGSNTKHVYTNSSGVLTAADFEIWVTNS